MRAIYRLVAGEVTSLRLIAIKSLVFTVAFFLMTAVASKVTAEFEKTLDGIVESGTTQELEAVQAQLKQRDLTDSNNAYMLAYTNWRLAHRLPRNEKSNAINYLKRRRHFSMASSNKTAGTPRHWRYAVRSLAIKSRVHGPV